MVGAGEIKAVAHAFSCMNRSDNLPFKLASYAFFDGVAIVAIKQRQVAGEQFDQIFYEAMEPFLPYEYKNNLTLDIYFLPVNSWEYNYGKLFMYCILEHCIDLKFIRSYSCEIEGNMVDIHLEPIVQAEHTLGLMQGWLRLPVGYLFDWALDKEFNFVFE